MFNPRYICTCIFYLSQNRGVLSRRKVRELGEVLPKYRVLWPKSYEYRKTIVLTIHTLCATRKRVRRIIREQQAFTTHVNLTMLLLSRLSWQLVVKGRHNVNPQNDKKKRIPLLEYTFSTFLDPRTVGKPRCAIRLLHYNR